MRTLVSKNKKPSKKQVQNKFEKSSGIAKGKKRMNERQDKAATILAKFIGNENLYFTETGKKFARRINKD